MNKDSSALCQNLQCYFKHRVGLQFPCLFVSAVISGYAFVPLLGIFKIITRIRRWFLILNDNVADLEVCVWYFLSELGQIELNCFLEENMHNTTKMWLLPFSSLFFCLDLDVRLFSFSLMS